MAASSSSKKAFLVSLRLGYGERGGLQSASVLDDLIAIPDSGMSDSTAAVKSWVTASCREVFHPRAAHCGPHFSNIFRAVFWQSVKLYAPFFLVVRLLNGRTITTRESFKSFVKSVLRGSLFLSINGPGTILLCCSARNLLGYHSRLAVTLSCFLACFLGISVEDPNRQRELTVYTSSVAVDSLFRMLVARGLAVPIKHGRALIFLAGLAISAMLYNEKRCTPGTHVSSMAWIAGKRASTETPEILNKPIDRSILRLFGLPADTLKKCTHTDTVYVASGFARGFLAGVGLRFLGMILSRRFTAKAFKEKLQFSSFLSLLVGLYRLGIVLTTKPGEKPSKIASLFSGALSGLSAFFSPSIELAMFAAGKTVDALLRTPSIAEEPANGQAAPRKREKSTLLVQLTFAAACALVFYNVVFENHNVRPSYMKFLHTTSAGHLRQMPRVSKRMMAELKTPNLTPAGAFD